MTIFYFGNATANATPITPYNGPTFRDAFDSGSNINGRTGWTVGYLSGFSSQANAITISSGKAGGTTGTGMFAGTSASIGLPVVKRRMAIGPFPAQTLIDHATLTTAGVTGFVLGVVNSASGGNLNALASVSKYVNNSPSSVTGGSIACGRAVAGDNFRTSYRISGSDTVLDMFHNGWATLSGVVVSGYSVAFTGSSGIKGSIGASALNEIEVADSTSQAWIELRWGTRVQARNSDGSVTLNVCVAYGQTAPTTLVYTIYDMNTGSEVALTGHTDVRVSTTNTDSYARFTVDVAASLLTSGGPFVMKVVRDRLLAGGQSVAWSPQWKPGLVCLSGGQSLNIGSATTTFTTTDTYTAVSGAQHTLARPTSTTVVGAENTRYTFAVSDNTPVTAWQRALSVGGYAVATADGGISATPIATRGVGTACHDALKECLDRHNRRANFICWMDGQNDASLNNPASYVSTILAISQDLEAYCGYIVPIQIDPVAAAWANGSLNDILWQKMRRTQWKLCQDYPTRFFYGAHSLDIQHDVGSNGVLHLSANGYGQMSTRRGKRSQKLLSLISHDPNGPSLASVSKVSATEIRCVYNLNGWDSLTLANTAYAANYNGGMIFSTAPTLNSTTIATKIAATGATVDASPSGGQQGINFTFPSSTFTSSAYVWAAYGQNPMNPADNGTLTDAVNLDLAGKASMIQGVKTGELNTALQPCFTADGLDYMVAS